MTTEPERTALEIRNFSKTFGATRAVVDAAFSIQGSSVHGLLGENGSGKSTLVKILSGYHAPDAGGSLRLWGVDIKLPIRASGTQHADLGFVHQTLGLADALSVTENLLIGEVTRPGRLLIRWREARAKTTGILAQYGLELDASQSAGSLTRSQQAMLAIVRAVETFRDKDGGDLRRGLLVLDEPSASFTMPEKEWLYGTIRAFTGNGGSVLLISHDIDEVLEITDEVTVLRDGSVQATRRTESVTGGELADLIVGRHVSPRRAESRGAANDRGELARIRDLAGRGVSAMDLDVYRGEVVGLTGLAGSGFEQILPLVFGVEQADTGVLEIEGRIQDLPRMKPHTALAMGIAMVPGDRERSGCVLDLPITDNVTLCSLGEYRATLRLSRAGMSASAREAIERYGIRAPHASANVGTLSGGNQQKVLLGKWLATHPRLLLLQEPTVGLDVGARSDIFGLIRAVAHSGTSVICASSDWEQLAEICDRVVIVANGRAAAVIADSELSETAIGHECYRVSTQSATVIGQPR
jgi:ribose transport system ATP-binding protein